MNEWGFNLPESTPPSQSSSGSELLLDSLKYTCSSRKSGIFSDWGVDSWNIAYSCRKGRRGIFWEGGVYSGSVAHICQKRRGIFSEGGVVSRSVAYSCRIILSHNIKVWCKFWDGGVDSGRFAHIIFWKGGIYSGRGVDSGSVAYIRAWYKWGYILGGRGRFWEGRTYKFVEKGVYSGREGYIPGWRGRFSDPQTSQQITNRGWIPGGRGRFWELPGSTPRYSLESTPGYSFKGV